VTQRETRNRAVRRAYARSAEIAGPPDLSADPRVSFRRTASSAQLVMLTLLAVINAGYKRGATRPVLVPVKLVMPPLFVVMVELPAVAELPKIRLPSLEIVAVAAVAVLLKVRKPVKALVMLAPFAELASLKFNTALLTMVAVPALLDESAVHRVVKAAAERAGLSAEVSAHWLRHAHASHSLNRGAPIHLVQQTLGHASAATTGRYLHARPTDSSARYLGV